MDFAFKLTVAAAAVGGALLAHRVIDDSSSEWQGKIAFYDYIERVPKTIENVLRYDNGYVVEIRLLYKDAGGCINISLANLIQIDHLTLIIKTNKNIFWSIEKNSKAIIVQKTEKENNVINMLQGSYRDTPLKFNYSKQEEYFNVWKVERIDSKDIGMQRIFLNNILSLIREKELSIPFSYVENCQVFLERVLSFINKNLPILIKYYDYSLMKSLEFEEIISKAAIDEIVMLQNTNLMKDYVGFLIKSDDGFYWSIEQTQDFLSVQKSYRQMDVLQLLHGKIREKGSEICRTITTIKNKDININQILNILKDGQIISKLPREYLEKMLRLINTSPETMSNSLTLYDCNRGLSTKLNNTFISLMDSVVISNISLYSKVAQAGEGGPADVSVDKCLILIIKTKEQVNWSLERVNDTICTQKSNNEVLLIERLNGTLRKHKPIHLQFPQSKLQPYQLKVKDLLLFLMKFQMKLSKDPSTYLILGTLRYLGVIHG